MKTLELRVSVSDERVLTVKLPDDVMPGYHSVVLVIDEPGSAAPARPALFNPAGILEELGIKLTLADFEASRRELWGTSTDHEADRLAQADILDRSRIKPQPTGGANE